MGVLVLALPFGVYTRPPDFWKLTCKWSHTRCPKEPQKIPSIRWLRMSIRSSSSSVEGPPRKSNTILECASASTLPQINIEAHKGPYIEDSNLTKGPFPLPWRSVSSKLAAKEERFRSHLPNGRANQAWIVLKDLVSDRDSPVVFSPLETGSRRQDESERVRIRLRASKVRLPLAPRWNFNHAS